MDRYVTVNQGEVFYMTEALARLEGMERGPAGNISLAAVFSIAREMDAEETIVVQETEYTGAGKHLQPQLSFARDNGIRIEFGDPADEVPGESIILPSNPSLIKAAELDLDVLRSSLIRHACGRTAERGEALTKEDALYLAEETGSTAEFVYSVYREIKRND